MEVSSMNTNNKIKNLLSSYKCRQFILWALDMCIILVSLMISALLTNKIPTNTEQIYITLVMYMIVHTISFTLFKCYSSLWRYAGQEELVSIVIGSTIYVPVFIILNTYMNTNNSILFFILNAIFITTFTGGARLLYRTGRRVKLRTAPMNNATKVLIIGAGSAGKMVIEELKDNPQLGKVAVGIIDDDINKIGRLIHNVKVLGNKESIKKIVDKYEIDEIIIAIASSTKIQKQEIIKICRQTKCTVKIIPGVYEIIDGKIDIKKIRDVEIEDLLGREVVNVDLESISEYIKNQVVVITGGGGSIGSELCRQIASFSPKHLVIIDNYENNAYAIQQELVSKYKDTLNLSTIIASIREEVRMDEIFREYKPDVVFHAAAHKHVPLMENSPSEAIKNNIFGTLNVAKLAHKYSVRKMVLISTDKAVNPTNIMGATKRAAEMLIQTLNNHSETEYVAVRFGNVLGSNGSVIPLFKKQIAEGGPVTITHPDIIRYFMTIPEAVQLVIQAGSMAKGGEIFVLDMGEPVKIVDLANNLIRLSGFEPGEDIKIEYTGLRPGEKLYEELLMNDEGLIKTDNKKIYIGQQIKLNEKEIEKHLDMLAKVIENEEVEFIDGIMRELVSTYIRPEEANKRRSMDEVAIAN